MKIMTRVWVAATIIAAVASSANAAEPSGPLAARPSEDHGPAQVWFERALSLDIGEAGSPDAVQAFAAMRRAADLGHTQAAFNVAVMLDSGRGAPRDVAQAAVWYARAAAAGNHRAAFNLGQLYESGEGVPANAGFGSRLVRRRRSAGSSRTHLAEIKSPADRPALVKAPDPLFPLKKSALEEGFQQRRRRLDVAGRTRGRALLRGTSCA